MTESLPAIIALLGTVLTIVIGYWQWKRQPENFLRQNFHGDRQIAYKGLWSLLPPKDSLGTNKDKLKEILIQVKDFSIKNELYLDEKHIEMVIYYVRELIDWHDFIEPIDRETNRILAELDASNKHEIEVLKRNLERLTNETHLLREEIKQWSIAERFLSKVFGVIFNLMFWVGEVFFVAKSFLAGIFSPSEDTLKSRKVESNLKEKSTKIKRLKIIRKDLAIEFKKVISGQS